MVITEEEKKKRKELLPEGAIIKEGVTDISAPTIDPVTGQKSKRTRRTSGRGLFGPNVNLQNVLMAKTGAITRSLRTPEGRQIINPPTGEMIPLQPEDLRGDPSEIIPQTQLEAAGAFEQVTPQEISLQPEGTIDVPLAGPAGGGIVGAILNNELVNDLVKKYAHEDSIAAREAFPVLGPETQREMALRAIRQKSFDEGVSFAESIGAFIEAIPAVGSLASKYASGLTQTPSGNAEDVLSEINKVKEAASTGQEKVRNGLEDPDYGLGRARSMEEQLAKLEGRMKLLINTSSILRANSDNVNTIQEQILEAKEKVARYRQASAFGLTAALTGTGRIIPTDELMFAELLKQSK